MIEYVESSAGARPAVCVLATTVEGTRSALAVAERLAEGFGARIAMLLPIPRRASTSDLDLTNDAGGGFEGLVPADARDVTMIACVGRPEHLVHTLADKHSLIVIGGPSGLWPSRERRLARRLTRQGYAVVFAVSS